MRIGRVIASSLLSLAATAAFSQGGTIETFPSKLLRREVKVAVHAPDPADLTRWRAARPDRAPCLVLFLNGANDRPQDLIDQGICADLAAREHAGELPPSLWIAPENFLSWYADRRDGTFPFERFLVEELIPAMERAHPGCGGSREARTVAGFSMGGFGALNVAQRTGVFSRCVALSPAMMEAPFQGTSPRLRHDLLQAFPMEPDAFAPWDPWRHLGGDIDLVLGCGTEDRRLLAVTKGLARKRAAAGHPSAAVLLWPGGHNWGFWTPAFERLAPWMAGGPLPTKLEP